jgi:hypothetical protein
MMEWEDGRDRRRTGVVITYVELEPCTVEAQLYAICLTQTQSFSVTIFVTV